jgi:hypothetical protein
VADTRSEDLRPSPRRSPMLRPSPLQPCRRAFPCSPPFTALRNAHPRYVVSIWRAPPRWPGLDIRRGQWTGAPRPAFARTYSLTGLLGRAGYCPRTVMVKSQGYGSRMRQLLQRSWLAGIGFSSLERRVPRRRHPRSLPHQAGGFVYRPPIPPDRRLGRRRAVAARTRPCRDKSVLR